jgi:hypothetical protein
MTENVAESHTGTQDMDMPRTPEVSWYEGI